MRAAVYRSTGPADVLEITELEDPHPGPGEVRVRLDFSGVNPTDWKSRSGASGPLRFDYQIPGQDGAGTIDEVGEGIDEKRVGEPVWVYHAAWRRQNGTAAQFTVIPANQAVRLPNGIESEQGAGLGIPFITAHGCLCGDGAIHDKTVLIAGGAGAVGNAAIQIAKSAGAFVITTISNKQKAELALGAGADEIVNYKQGDAANQVMRVAPNGVDRIVELAPTTNLELDLAVLKPGGTIVAYSAESTDPVFPIGTMMGKHYRFEGFLVYTLPQPRIDAAIEFIVSELSKKALKPLPSSIFKLDEVAQAHEAVEANTVGKVLIDVRQ